MESITLGTLDVFYQIELLVGAAKARKESAYLDSSEDKKPTPVSG